VAEIGFRSCCPIVFSVRPLERVLTKRSQRMRLNTSINFDTVAQRHKASRHIWNEEAGEHKHRGKRHFSRRRVRGHISESYHT
jgi:hypothetical protein